VDNSGKVACPKGVGQAVVPESLPEEKGPPPVEEKAEALTVETRGTCPDVGISLGYSRCSGISLHIKLKM
jgi:hypothetical protein